MKQLAILRDFKPTDKDFIIATWLKSMRDTPTFITHIPTGIWTRNKGPEIEKILHNADITICCSKENPDQIYGYLVADSKHPVIHYMYVKKVYSGFGFARRLLDAYLDGVPEDMGVALSHITMSFVERFFKGPKKYRRFFYNPFIIKELNYEEPKQIEASVCV